MHEHGAAALNGQLMSALGAGMGSPTVDGGLVFTGSSPTLRRPARRGREDDNGDRGQPDGCFAGDVEDGGLATLVSEFGWNEALPALQADARFWLDGFETLQLVVLFCCFGHGRGMGGDPTTSRMVAEVWGRDARGVPEMMHSAVRGAQQQPCCAAPGRC